METTKYTQPAACNPQLATGNLQPNWLCLDTGPGAAGFNMALDEALLEAMPRFGQPVLRFYGWTERAASFGYFQKYSQAAALTPLRPLVRRPTGGGLVPHDADWTYSLCIPAGHEWYSLRAKESYRQIHEWIRASLACLGEATELAAVAHKPTPGQCFSGCEISDVLQHDSKIAGAAQRRTRLGLLIQGSVQPADLALTRSEWQRAMLGVGEAAQSIQWSNLEPDPDLIAQAKRLAQQKYSQESYHQRK